MSKLEKNELVQLLNFLDLVPITGHIKRNEMNAIVKKLADMHDELLADPPKKEK